MSKVAEPVTDKPAIGKAAFAAARASLSAESADQPAPEEAPVRDDTPTETPAEEPETVADQPTETTTEETGPLSPEELAAIPEKQRANAIRWTAKLTQKSQELAAKERELEELWKHAEAERAQTRGAPQDTTTVAAKATEAIAGLPEELKFLEPVLKPLFEQYGQTIIQSVDAKVKPIAEAHTAMMTEAAAAQTKATLESFTTKHPDWQQHEPEMVKLAQKLLPTAGNMTDAEYMETLYTLVTAKQSKADLVKATVKQINKSAASVEPNTPGVAESRVEHAMPANWSQMDNKERMKASFEAAKAGIVWKK